MAPKLCGKVPMKRGSNKLCGGISKRRKGARIPAPVILKTATAVLSRHDRTVDGVKLIILKHRIAKNNAVANGRSRIARK